MNQFKKLSEEEIAALDATGLAQYQTELAAYEAEVKANEEKANEGKAPEDLSSLDYKALSALAKERGYTFPQTLGKEKLLKLMENPPVQKESTEEKAEMPKYVNAEEIEAMKEANPSISKFYVTSDKTAFPSLWLAENHVMSGDVEKAIQIVD